MTKNELARELAVSEKLHLSTAVKAVDGIVRIMKETLAKGEEITLRGFGTLSVVKREQKNALHFKTKEPIVVPAHNSVKFKISNELKNTLNNGNVD
ncbi:MAG: integration host factor subunit beta [Bacteroidales bacterium]|nr:integration host factor subunit beta [Bacteroidales bacterium]